MRLKYDFHGGGGFVAMRRVFPFKLPETFGCFRTAAAHILINCDGPAIQPGPRRYTRSWVRDCVIMGAALGKAGLPKALREFLTWYAQFQRDASFVPCVVDRDGVDWLVEHDSHGQFIWGFREVIRESGDPRFLRIMYPRARAAANYLIKLRSQRMSKDYAGGDTIHVEIANTITPSTRRPHHRFTAAGWETNHH